jgi:hypothetical protein
MDERPMRREIATGIEIDAPPASVWAVLSDFSSYPEWNTFLRWVEGRIAEGERIRFCFEPPRGFRFKVTATILKVTPERTLRWAGVLLTARLFRAEHYFELTSSPGGRTPLFPRRDLHGTPGAAGLARFAHFGSPRV